MKLSEASPFLRGYVEAALFTTDAYPPSGCDYAECGRADELAPELPAWWILEADVACRSFQEANAELLAKAGDDDQNGRDFWFSRNGHGVGFWDRGYPDEIGDALQDAAKIFGEHYLLPEDFGQVSDEWLQGNGRAVTRNPETGRWYFETSDSEVEQWASEEEFPSREEAARACREDFEMEAK
jgi:hypothetical protein